MTPDNSSKYYDPHLNTFYVYGTSEKENNITRAFIITLKSMPKAECLNFLYKIGVFSYDVYRNKISVLNDDEIEKCFSIHFYLQASKELPADEKKAPDIKKMLAFSPTGRCWGFEPAKEKDIEEMLELCKKSDKEIEREIRKRLENSQPQDEDEREKEIKNACENVQGLKKRIEHGSIPDGWIVVKNEDKPFACIALENKLYDLDPFQLINHIKQWINPNNDNGFSNPEQYKEVSICYATYTKICDSLEESHSRDCVAQHNIQEFVSCVELYGYREANNFIELSKRLQKPEVDLRVCQQNAHRLCKEALISVVKDKSKVKPHRKWMYSIESDNKFLGKMGLHVSPINGTPNVELVIIVGPTQTIARGFYKAIYDENNDEVRKVFDRLEGEGWSVKPNFHLHHGRSNMDKSYGFSDEASIESYLSFWCRHREDIRQVDAKKLEKFFKDGDDGKIFSLEAYRAHWGDEERKTLDKDIKHAQNNIEKAKSWSDVAKELCNKKRNIVPEICATKSWLLEEFSPEALKNAFEYFFQKTSLYDSKFNKEGDLGRKN